MFRLVESIKIADGYAWNIAYHEKRIARSLKHLFNIAPYFKIEEVIGELTSYKEDTYKCRVLYNEKFHGFTIDPYNKRKISSLKLVHSDTIDYRFKYENRDFLNELTNQKGNEDDVLIIKNGLLSDTSYANIALYDGNQWHTPSTPLLPGTKRAFLIETKQIIEKEISPNDLRNYQHVSLINAMMDLGDMEIPIKNIRF